MDRQSVAKAGLEINLGSQSKHQQAHARTYGIRQFLQ